MTDATSRGRPIICAPAWSRSRSRLSSPRCDERAPQAQASEFTFQSSRHEETLRAETADELVRQAWIKRVFPGSLPGDVTIAEHRVGPALMAEMRVRIS